MTSAHKILIIGVAVEMFLVFLKSIITLEKQIAREFGSQI